VTTSTTGLAAALSGLSGRSLRRPRCQVGIVLEQLHSTDEAAAEALEDALTNIDVTGSGIAAALADAGINVPAYSVNRHRKRGAGNGCMCPR
jgi:hypothetical protein